MSINKKKGGEDGGEMNLICEKGNCYLPADYYSEEEEEAK